MSAERIPIVATDGHRYVIEVHPVEDAPAVVLVLPAMGVEASYYRPVVEQIVGAGLAVVTADLRGHGLSEVRARRGVDYGYHELASVDLPATVAAVGSSENGHPGASGLAFSWPLPWRFSSFGSTKETWFASAGSESSP